VLMRRHGQAEVVGDDPAAFTTNEGE
jgi:hypothetical protein